MAPTPQTVTQPPPIADSEQFGEIEPTLRTAPSEATDRIAGR